MTSSSQQATSPKTATGGTLDPAHWTLSKKWWIGAFKANGSPLSEEMDHAHGYDGDEPDWVWFDESYEQWHWDIGDTLIAERYLPVSPKFSYIDESFCRERRIRRRIECDTCAGIEDDLRFECGPCDGTGSLWQVSSD